MAWHPFRNLGLKAAALALGTALWFTVSGHQVERRFPVPVFYRNVPQGLELTGEQADQVNVHVRGGDTIIAGLGQNQIFIIVDLGNGREGVNVISLRTEQVAAPMGLSVLQVDPNSVTVTLEPSDNKRTYIDRVVEFRNGAKSEQVNADPSTVAITVRGPAASLRALSPLSVVPYVDLAGRAPGQYNLPVRIDLPGLTISEIKPATVSVRVR